MGGFSLYKGACQGPGEFTLKILFIRKYKGYEYHFPTRVVIHIDPFGIIIC